MNPKAIDLITNIIAFLLAILEPLMAYFKSQPFNWQTFAFCILGAVVAYFTGKSQLYVLKKQGIDPKSIKPLSSGCCK